MVLLKLISGYDNIIHLFNNSVLWFKKKSIDKIKEVHYTQSQQRTK